MINIKLTDKFTMRSSQLCLKLCKQGVTGEDSETPGEITSHSIADTTSFDSFFRSYVQHSLLNATDANGDDITSFADLMVEMNKVLDQIRDMFNFNDLTAGKPHKQLVEELEKSKLNTPEQQVKKRRKKK